MEVEIAATAPVGLIRIRVSDSFVDSNRGGIRPISLESMDETQI